MEENIKLGIKQFISLKRWAVVPTVMNLQFPQKMGIWGKEELSAAQGLYSMDLVNIIGARDRLMWQSYWRTELLVRLADSQSTSL
jgi:hypothetical protein